MLCGHMKGAGVVNVVGGDSCTHGFTGGDAPPAHTDKETRGGVEDGGTERHPGTPVEVWDEDEDVDEEGEECQYEGQQTDEDDEEEVCG